MTGEGRRPAGDFRMMIDAGGARPDDSRRWPCKQQRRRLAVGADAVFYGGYFHDYLARRPTDVNRSNGSPTRPRRGLPISDPSLFAGSTETAG